MCIFIVCSFLIFFFYLLIYIYFYIILLLSLLTLSYHISLHLSIYQPLSLLNKVLSDVWLGDDFRRGVSNGWSTLVLNTTAVSSNKIGGYKDENTQLLDEYNSGSSSGGSNSLEG